MTNQVEGVSLARDRINAGSEPAAYWFEVAEPLVTGGYSAADPIGASRSSTDRWTQVPGRVVWGGNRARIIQPDGGGGYIFIQVTATVMDIPIDFLKLLDRTRRCRVPQETEQGRVMFDCRIVSVNQSHAGRSLTLILSVDTPPQE